jgi:hypothetical protein
LTLQQAVEFVNMRKWIGFEQQDFAMMTVIESQSQIILVYLCLTKRMQQA